MTTLNWQARPTAIEIDEWLHPISTKARINLRQVQALEWEIIGYFRGQKAGYTGPRFDNLLAALNGSDEDVCQFIATLSRD